MYFEYHIERSYKFLRKNGEIFLKEIFNKMSLSSSFLNSDLINFAVTFFFFQRNHFSMKSRQMKRRDISNVLSF